jgi:hypothetical protein
VRSTTLAQAINPGAAGRQAIGTSARLPRSLAASPPQLASGSVSPGDPSRRVRNRLDRLAQRRQPGNATVMNVVSQDAVGDRVSVQVNDGLS